jgi:hypothetical protein
MTGGHAAHPLLITLANIDSSLRLSSSSHALKLLALIPVPKFIGVPKKLHGILENRLLHACLDFITYPLKITARTGTWMGDYAGAIRRCFTPLVAYIADTPEAAALAGVAGKTSHLTMASFREFGDPFRHPPRTAGSILASLDDLHQRDFDPSNIVVYAANALELHRLNGVDSPFWRDWELPDGTLPNPSQFFPIEILHHLHKSFWDHDVKWILRAVGDRELDLRFSLLQPQSGYRHFAAGISSLKQVTGREHRDIQRYVLGLIADCAHAEFVICVRALLDLRYLSQLHNLDFDTLNDIVRALEIFHQFKQVILDLKLRVGKKGNAMTHFEIPKLELLQSIVPSIMWSGALPQWSADVTERLHIDFIKAPRGNTNNHNYYSQICRHLDRDEKRRHFELATAIHDAADPDSSPHHQATEPDWIFDTHGNNGANNDWMSELPQVAQAFGPPRPVTNLFAVAAATTQLDQPATLFPRTFATPTTAFHLNVKAHTSHASITELSTKFNLPNILPALRDFFLHYLQDQQNRAITGRRGPLWNADAPFEDVRIWHSVRVQAKGGNSPTPTPSRKLFASPPSKEWPTGRCDTAIFSVDGEGGPAQPPPGLEGIIISIPSPLDTRADEHKGFFIGQIRTIFHPLWEVPTTRPLYLAYVERFDVVPQTHLPRGSRLAPDPIHGMYVLRRAFRSDGSPMGGIIPLYHLRMPVNLIPRFGAKASAHLTSRTSFDNSRTFFLNHYFDKEDFSFFRESLF